MRSALFIEHTGMSMGNQESLPRHPALAPELPRQLVLGHPWVMRVQATSPEYVSTLLSYYISQKNSNEPYTSVVGCLAYLASKLLGGTLSSGVIGCLGQVTIPAKTSLNPPSGSPALISCPRGQNNSCQMNQITSSAGGCA